jgi:hypothetical protein
MHDKYTFYDTESEREQVEVYFYEDDKIMAEITVYMNM